MTQAPIAINGREVIDLSLRNCIRESLTEQAKLSVSIELYTKLLEHIGKIPSSIDDNNEGYVNCECKSKYRYTYTTGCHMARHVDTIKGDTHIGSLIVVRESAIKGGDLLIDGDEDSESGHYCSITGSYISVDIIPLGVYHEVTPVIEGRRITDVYEIHIDNPSNIIDRTINVFQKNVLNLQCLSITESISTGEWDTSLIEKYTKGIDYIVFPLKPDPIESLILKMIIDITGITEYITGLVYINGNSCSYRDNSCTLIGSIEDKVYEYSSYNDEGYDTFSYRIANIIYIPPRINSTRDTSISSHILKTHEKIFDNTVGSVYESFAFNIDDVDQIE